MKEEKGPSKIDEWFTFSIPFGRGKLTPWTVLLLGYLIGVIVTTILT